MLSGRVQFSFVGLVGLLLSAGFVLEAWAQGDPLDLDRDGLSAEEERLHGTDPTRADTDEDGLLDGWEVHGYHRGGLVEPLRDYGADPRRPDVFVEIDWMASADGTPESEASNALLVYQAAVDVVRVFEHSGTGIAIHFDLGPDIRARIGPGAIEDGIDFSSFETEPDPGKILPYQGQFPGRPVCDGSAGASSLVTLYDAYHDPRFFRPSRRNIFYYIAWAEQRRPPEESQPENEIAQYHPFVDSFNDELAGRDGLRPAGVEVGVIFRKPAPALDDPRLLRYYHSVSLLHELGHAFGLGHGGALPGYRWDNTNFKVNYPSIMNYRYLYWGVDLADGIPTMDFSHGLLAPLCELELFEPRGLGGRPSEHILRNLGVVHIAGTAFPLNVDWNQDGDVTLGYVRRDLNQNGVIDVGTFTDHDDWGKFLRDGFSGIGRNAFRGCGLPCGLGEEVVYLPGDFNGDGLTDLFLSNGSAMAWALAGGAGRFEMDSAAVRRGSVGDWEIAPAQGFLAGPFLGGERDLVFWHRGDSAALLDYGGGEPALVARAEGLVRAQGPAAGAAWELKPHDRFFAVQLPGGLTQIVVTDGRDVGVFAAGGELLGLVTLWRGGEALRSWTGGGPVFARSGRRLAGGEASFFIAGGALLAEVRIGIAAIVPGVLELPAALSMERLDRDQYIPPAGTNEVGWRLSSSDCLTCADLDGDGNDELLLLAGKRLGVVRWGEGGGGLVWAANGRIGAFPFGEASERLYRGQFVPGGGEELVLSSGRRWLTLAWNGEASSLEVLAANSDFLLTDLELPNLPLSLELKPGQALAGGRFRSGEADMLLVEDAASLLLASFDSRPGPQGGDLRVGFRPVERLDGRVGRWSMHKSDALLAVEVDRDAALEVLARKGDLLGIIDFSPRPGAPYLARLESEDLALTEVTSFRRGDANDSRAVDISDAVKVLNFLFLGDVLGCKDAADANDSGQLDIADAVYILLFLFMHEEPPGPPGPYEPGIDPSPDALTCGEL